MTREKALEILSDGHTIISPEKAQEVCVAVKVPFGKHLVHKWNTIEGQGKHSLYMKEGYENSDGVYTLYLSEYVAQVLGVDKKAGFYHGRGSQAQAYSHEIAKVI